MVYERGAHVGKTFGVVIGQIRLIGAMPQPCASLRSGTSVELAAWLALFGLALGCWAQPAAPATPPGAVAPRPSALGAGLGPRVTVASDINIAGEAQLAAELRNMRRQSTAAQTKAKIGALNALLEKYPCEEGCSGHGKCSTLAHITDPTKQPIKEATVHGRRETQSPAPPAALHSWL